MCELCDTLCTNSKNVNCCVQLAEFYFESKQGDWDTQKWEEAVAQITGKISFELLDPKNLVELKNSCLFKTPKSKDVLISVLCSNLVT